MSRLSRLTRAARMTGVTVCLTIVGWLVLLDALLEELFPRQRT